jgi:hypothetical protein
MDFLLNRGAERVPSFEAVATQGDGVHACLNRIARMVMAKFISAHNMAVNSNTVADAKAEER